MKMCIISTVLQNRHVSHRTEKVNCMADHNYCGTTSVETEVPLSLTRHLYHTRHYLAQAYNRVKLKNKVDINDEVI